MYWQHVLASAAMQNQRPNYLPSCRLPILAQAISFSLLGLRALIGRIAFHSFVRIHPLEHLTIRLAAFLKRHLALFLLAISCTASAETHETIQAALSWEMPSNNCKKPNPLRDQAANRSQAGVIGHGAGTNTTIGFSGGAPTVFDVDHYQIDRYNRRKARWENCVSNYKSALLEEFALLRSSAEFGVTTEQAKIIVNKLAKIQAAVISPNGVAETD
jgi:hypothetical protein